MKPTINIGLINYEGGNCGSVIDSVHRLGYNIKSGSNARDYSSSDLLLIPGVGSYGSAIRSLIKSGMYDCILQHVREGKPVLGICLGMQLLSTDSLEGGYSKGLNLIPGQVEGFRGNHWHIGWNNLEMVSQRDELDYAKGKYVYFNHSFIYNTSLRYQVSQSCFKGESFPAIILKDNIMGMQFHPEKSQSAGLSILSMSIEVLLNA